MKFVITYRNKKFLVQVDAGDAWLLRTKEWHPRYRNTGNWWLFYGVGADAGKQLHREIAGAAPGQVVSFKNGDTADLRRENLRLVTKETAPAMQIARAHKKLYKLVES